MTKKEETEMNEESHESLKERERMDYEAKCLPDFKNDDDKVVAKIYETDNYGQFRVDKDLCNDDRIKSLKLKYTLNHESLPLVAVKENLGQWEIIVGQDSYCAAKELRIPVYYYETFDSKQFQRSNDLSFNDMEDLLKHLLDKYSFGC